MRRRLTPLLVFLAVLLLFGYWPAPKASAILSARGPIDVNHGYPSWYEDSTGLRLELCLDEASGLCLLELPTPGAPISFPDNFPDEAFWWAGEAAMPAGDPAFGGQALLVLALEAAFLNEVPIAGDQMSFGRVRIRVEHLIPGQTYTVTHPFGVDTFVATADVRSINFTEDIGCMAGPCDFAAAFTSRIGPFLVWDPTAPAPPPGFVGDPGIEHTVVGSPFGTNFFRIEGPDVGGPGVDLIETDLFTVMGKISTGPLAGPGVLRVTTSPPVASQVLIDGIPRDTWGLDWLKLDQGIYEVSFSDVQGFTTPAPQMVTVLEGVTAEVTGVFTLNGFLRVITSPGVPGTISVGGVPRDDWGMWTDLLPATYEVCFGDVAGFTAPPCRLVTVVAGSLATVIATYTPTP